ncbi:semaphorin-3D isoform X2 [Salarias fasciatus]|uniref:semaphorin-3D isoform X2 n=1 Tax=Salarias fasciatus TaxID=181472 RepID=UPI001176DAC3|nr:semaphorin-3D-like isoform X2 [Salarias fasciatus]
MKPQTAGGRRSRGRVCPLVSVLVCLIALTPLRPADSGDAPDAKPWSQPEARLTISHADLRAGLGVFWEPGVGGVTGVDGGHQALLLDEDRGWILVGGRDHVHLLRTDPDGTRLTAQTVSWPASRDNVERCLMAGKSPETDCSNFVRLLQPINRTSVYACGTGAFQPTCTFLNLNPESEEPSLSLSHIYESGQGKCPFSAREPFTALLTDGDLYSGTSVDFMGVNAGLFRTAVQGPGRQSLRSEAYDNNWLNEPDFVDSFSVPDTHSPDDDKVYVFFRERAAEAGPWDQRVYSRVARVCKNDVGGKRSLINRWTTFLKARLVCSVPGPSGVDTHFDQLEDIFVLETKDPQNPVVYGVFSTSSSVFRGSAVCVFSMASIRAVFNGPFAHRDGPESRWVEYRGRIPYPRPGTCPSETYDARYRSTRDLPDEAVSFSRQHQLMWDPVLPLGARPVFTRVHWTDRIRRLVVDRVEAEDGVYDVLHLGTDQGKVLKVVSVLNGGLEPEEVVLEELNVFQTPILNMKLSTKRQLWVSSAGGVAQLGVQRCGRYGAGCEDCCLSRDPYCSWDGQACSRVFPSSRRRARRQDIRYGDPWSQCPATEDEVEVRPVFAVEGNSSFLECSPRSPQAELRWKMQLPDSEQQQSVSDPEESREVPLSSSSRFLQMSGGLLVRFLALSDSGLYTCSSQERSYRRVVARYQLHVVPSAGLGATRHPQPRPHPWLPPQATPYRDPRLAGGNSLSAERHCEQLWFREKRRQQKLRALKLKEGRKARVRRNNPALPPP